MYLTKSISFNLTPEENKAETQAKEIRTKCSSGCFIKSSLHFHIKRGTWNSTRALLTVVYELPPPSWHITARYRFVNMSNVATSKIYMYSMYIINYFITNWTEPTLFSCCILMLFFF